MFKFLRTLQTFHSSCTFFIPPSHTRGFQFPHILTNSLFPVFLLLFSICHPNGCEMVCVFELCSE